MIENLIISLVLLFIPGITYVAYKHPDLYVKSFSNKLFMVSAIVLLIFSTYNLAITLTFGTIKEFLIEGKKQEVEAALNKIKAPYFIWVSAMALMVYSFVLSWLAYHMKYTVNKNGH